VSLVKPQKKTDSEQHLGSSRQTRSDATHVMSRVPRCNSCSLRGLVQTLLFSSVVVAYGSEHPRQGASPSPLCFSSPISRMGGATRPLCSWTTQKFPAAAEHRRGDASEQLLRSSARSRVGPARRGGALVLAGSAGASAGKGLAQADALLLKYDTDHQRAAREGKEGLGGGTSATKCVPRIPPPTPPLLFASSPNMSPLASALQK
jgi:hypothetical protein